MFAYLLLSFIFFILIRQNCFCPQLGKCRAAVSPAVAGRPGGACFPEGLTFFAYFNPASSARLPCFLSDFYKSRNVRYIMFCRTFWLDILSVYGTYFSALISAVRVSSETDRMTGPNDILYIFSFRSSVKYLFRTHHDKPGVPFSTWSPSFNRFPENDIPN